MGPGNSLLRVTVACRWRLVAAPSSRAALHPVRSFRLAPRGSSASRWPDEAACRVSFRRPLDGSGQRRGDFSVVSGHDGTIANSNAMRYYWA